MGRSSSCCSGAGTTSCCLGAQRGQGWQWQQRCFSEREKCYSWGKKSEFWLRRGWKAPRQIPLPWLSSNTWEKAPAQRAPLLSAFRSIFKLPSVTAKTRNMPCTVKMRAQILLVGPKHAGDQDTRSWERPHGVRSTYPLTARQKFPVCSQEGKHPGQCQAGGSQLGRFRTPREGWEDPMRGMAR